VSLTAYLGYGLPASIAGSVAQVSTGRIRELIDGDLTDLLEVRDGDIQLRHRVMGEVIFNDCMDADLRYETSLALGRSLAPHVSLESIRATTRFYRISRALMGNEFARQFSGGQAARAMDWYEALEPHFGWNARFWEQRALNAADAELFEPAYSWAQEAVSLVRDSFTLNTVGTVLMRRALKEARLGAWPTESFRLAETSLREARSHRGQLNDYPFETFFSYAIRVATKVKEIDVAQKEWLREVWMEWHASLLVADSATQLQIGQKLQTWTAQATTLLGWDAVHD
jgi:hypothetical protein